MSMPRTVSEIDRLREALRLSQTRHVELTHALEDMRAERNTAHCLMVEHATAALSSAKELKMATSEIDSLRNELDDALDRIAELEEGNL